MKAKPRRGQPPRVVLIVEGGGASADLRTTCREAFAKFLRSAGFEGRMPRIVAVGRRDAAFQRFKGDVDRAVLLVDSEQPVDTEDAWEHLERSARWSRPAGAEDDQAHLMVRCMEAWFLADPQTVAAYFGGGFRAKALPGGKCESIEPQQLVQALENASRDSRKGRYRKAAHSFDLLARLRPDSVRAASPWAARFLDTLAERVAR